MADLTLLKRLIGTLDDKQVRLFNATIEANFDNIIDFENITRNFSMFLTQLLSGERRQDVREKIITEINHLEIINNTIKKMHAQNDVLIELITTLHNAPQPQKT